MIKTKGGTMANINFIPYDQGLNKSDYIVNPDIEAFDLEANPINPVSINKFFLKGSWAVLQVIPILLINSFTYYFLSNMLIKIFRWDLPPRLGQMKHS